jgi:hypothetical protein
MASITGLDRSPGSTRTLTASDYSGEGEDSILDWAAAGHALTRLKATARLVALELSLMKTMFASGRELPGASVQWIVLGPVHYSTGLVKGYMVWAQKRLPLFCFFRGRVVNGTTGLFTKI